VKFTERDLSPLAGMDKKQAKRVEIRGNNFNKGGNQTLVKKVIFKLKKMLQPKKEQNTERYKR
jgi:hypothetical protein